MTPLHPSLTLPLRKQETPESFCSRSALLLGLSARAFSLDMGGPFQKIVDGEPVALETLARRTHSDFGQLAAGSITKTGERRYSFGGQALVRESLSRKTLCVCPRCLNHDMDEQDGPPGPRPFGRTPWILGSVRTCPEHRIGLVTISKDDHPHRVHDSAALVQPALPALAHLEAHAPRRDVSALEDHVITRCTAGAPDDVSFLNVLPLYAAVKACEVIGAIATHGTRVKAEHLSSDQWHGAGAAGFEIASEGEDSIRAFLAGLQDHLTSTKGDWGPRLAFGRLYEWLAHESDDPAYDPLRDIIRRHVVATMPLGRGDKVFGCEVRARQIHSVRSASLETGTHPKRLRKLLHAAGHITSEAMALSDARVMFDAEATQGFLERVSEAMTLREAAVYLNVPRPHDRLLFEAGFIVPFVRGGAGTLNDHAFAKRDLDAFLERLLADASDVTQENKTLLSIPSAAKRVSCSAMEIVRLLLDRQLTRVRHRDDAPGYMSVLVDPKEVKPFVHGKVEGSITLREVERRLGTSTPVVKALIERGHLPSRIEINPVNRCPRKVVKQEDPDAFIARYVTLHAAAKDAGIHFMQLKSLLTSADIDPAFPPEIVHATFYDRKSVMGMSA